MTTKNAKATKRATAKSEPATVKADAKLAAERHTAERAEILRNIDTAEDLLGSALIEGLRMTVLYGATSADEVGKYYTRCNNPGVYASYFNRGHKAQLVVGEKLALDAIERATAGSGGKAFVKARDALKAIVDAAKAKGEKRLDGRAATATVRAAVQQAVAPKPQADKKPAARGTKAQDDKTLRVAANECGKGAHELATFVMLASQQAHAMNGPIGREEQYQAACRKLADAAEAFAPFIRK